MRFLIVMASLAAVLAVGIITTPHDSTFQPLPADQVEPQVIVQGIVSLGTVSLFPSDDIEKFQHIADWLAIELTGWEHARGTVRFAPTMAAMANLLENGEVDLYFDSPYPSMQVASRAGSVPFLRRWKGGVGEYHSVVFTRADSGIENVEDLRGRSIAFEGEFSTSGYFLPRAVLERAGLPLSSDEGWTGATQMLRYSFSRDDGNTLLWVKEGRVDVGATDHPTYQAACVEDPGMFRVVTRSPTVPRSVVSHRPGLSPEYVSSVHDALVSMAFDEEGKVLLSIFDGTLRFDELDSVDVDLLGLLFGAQPAESMSR